jgi:hypothetical protein
MGAAIRGRAHYQNPGNQRNEVEDLLNSVLTPT